MNNHFTNKTFTILALSVFTGIFAGADASSQATERPVAKYKPVDQSCLAAIKSRLVKYQLPNGLCVILLPDNRLPEVVMYLGYNVGSVDETDETRGMAHLVEHMIFKGTEKLSETDIPHIAAKFGVSYNAGTAKDVTFYHFKTDSANWKPFVGILADSAVNATFKPEHLQSEANAVVAELQMYRNDPGQVMLQNIHKNIFPENHGYTHPIIGYVDKIAAMDTKALREFYKKHYTMDNAALVVVGNFDLEAMKAEIGKEFGPIPGSGQRKQAQKPQFVGSNKNTSSTISHQIGNPLACLSWLIPGKNDYKETALARLCAHLLSDGSAESLKKCLVEDLKLSQSFVAIPDSLAKQGSFVCCFSCPEENIGQCESIVYKQIEKFAKCSVDQKQLERSIAEIQNGMIAMLESYDLLAMRLLDFDMFCNTGPEALFEIADFYSKLTPAEVQEFFAKYLNKPCNHKVVILPLTQETLPLVKAEIENFMTETNKLLENHKRTTPVQEPKHALTIGDPVLIDFSCPQPTKAFVLENGLKVVAMDRKDLPQVVCSLDSIEGPWINGSLDGRTLFGIASAMLTENSTLFTKEQTLEFFETLGAQKFLKPTGLGLIVTTPNFQQAFEHLLYIAQNPSLRQEDLDKLVSQYVAACQDCSQNAFQLNNRYQANLLYKGTEFDWTFEQAIERCKQIDLSQIEWAWKEMSVPSKLILTIVGNLPENCEELVRKNLGTLKDRSEKAVARRVPEMAKTVENQIASHKLTNTTQQLTLLRPNKLTFNDYTERIQLSLLNKIMFEGLASKIYSIRQEAGLFYTAGGGFALDANEKHSSDIITVIIDPDKSLELSQRLELLFTKIRETGITESDLASAKKNYIANIIRGWTTNIAIGGSLLFAAANNIDFDYGKKTIEAVNAVTVQDVNAMVEKYVTLDGWALVEVGA